MPDLTPPPKPYPYLRVGHIGAEPVHPGIGNHIDLGPLDGQAGLAETIRHGLDYVLLGGAGEARMSDHELRVVTALEGEGIPTVLRTSSAADFQSELAAVVSHVIADEPLVDSARAMFGPERVIEYHRVVDPLEVLLPEDPAPDFLSAEKIAERRRVLVERSPRAQVDRLAESLGLLKEPAPLVTAIIISRRAEHLDHTLSNLKRQVYPRLDPLLVIDPLYEKEARRATAGWDIPVRVETAQPRSTLADRLNLGVHHAHGEIITVFEENALYGHQHIADLVQVLQHSGAHIVGKASWHVWNEDTQQIRIRSPRLQHTTGEVPATGTLTMHRATARAVGFTRRAKGVNWAVSQRILNAGGSIISAHAFDTLLLSKGQTMNGLVREVPFPEVFPFEQNHTAAETKLQSRPA